MPNCLWLWKMSLGVRSKRYRPIHSSVNDQLLGKFATETRWQILARNTGSALQIIFKEIDRLEKTAIETSQLTRYAELFPPLP